MSSSNAPSSEEELAVARFVSNEDSQKPEAQESANQVSDAAVWGLSGQPPPVPATLLQEWLDTQGHEQDLDLSQFEAFQETWYYTLRSTGDLTIPQDLLDQVKRICLRTSNYTPSQREVLHSYISSILAKDQPQLVPPTSPRDLEFVAALEKTATIKSSLVMNLVMRNWDLVDAINMKVYKQQREIVTLRKAIETLDSPSQHRETLQELQDTKKKNCRLESEVSILRAELMLSDQRAATMERGWQASEFRNAKWRDRTNLEEARLRDAQMTEDIRREDLKDRMRTRVEGPLNDMIKDLRGEGPLDQKARTRIAIRVEGVLDIIEGMRGPGLWKALGYGDIEVASESERDLNLKIAVEKKLAVLRETPAHDTDPSAAVRKAYTQGQRDGRLAMLVDKMSARDPERELSRDQYVFTAADFRAQVKTQVAERVDHAMVKKTKRIHGEAEGKTCLAIHLIMKATATDSKAPQSLLSHRLVDMDQWGFPSLADRVADYIFENDKHILLESCWYRFHEARPHWDRNSFNFEHPLGVQELEGGYFHRLSIRVAYLRKGIKKASNVQEDKRTAKALMDAKTVKVQGDWADRDRKGKLVVWDLGEIEGGNLIEIE